LIIANAQVIHSNKIDSILNLVSLQSISKMDKELSGDTIVTIGGVSQILYSRYWTSIGNVLASQYIFEKFQSYGLTPQYMINNATNIHVYAVKTGTKYPNRKYIIGAHYDDIISWGIISDTIHGADDNASGVCAVLEAARLLANMNLDYTVIFVAFDEEEDGGSDRGSAAFADTLYFRGDTVLGMINVDMIGFHTALNNIATIITDTNSYSLYNIFDACNQSYNTGFTFYPEWNLNVSDHQSFWNRGYKAITPEEDNGNFNSFYHSVNDRFDKFNVQYFHKFVKNNVAALLTLVLDYNVMMNHIPLGFTVDTSSRIAKVHIKAPFKIASANNAPRLYYKINNGNFNFINASSIVQDTFKFTIPGEPAGSAIAYYFALQDSAGSVSVTLPNGGSGINPPGTTPPPNTFRYDIYLDNNQCSNTLPKPINDLQFTYDTINVNQSSKIINKAKVNLTIYHPNDGDLVIQFQGPNGMINLSQGNGSGGANYINTTFDDSASLSITQGTPPFTGSYRPQNSLSQFNNQPASWNWILRVFDTHTGNQGSLVSWCILLQLKNTVSVTEQNIPLKYELSQNYPNPFNPVTRISYRIAENTKVKLSVFDILGKEVKILVNEKQSAGNYEVIFNVADLPSGVYFYQLLT
jgi:subtilisin-like proprotein convertase family protein